MPVVDTSAPEPKPNVRSDQIIWEEPPPTVKKIGRTVWERRLLPLMEPENIGKWARVFTSPTSKGSGAGTLSGLNNRKLTIPDGEWEFRATDFGTDGSAVYARYLGPEGTKAAQKAAQTKYGSETSTAESRAAVEEAVKIATDENTHVNEGGEEAGEAQETEEVTEDADPLAALDELDALLDK